MEPLFLTTILTCHQLLGIANRLKNNPLLSPQQKTEIILVLREYVPSCPVVVRKDERPKRN